jgi:hypothetical protein
MSDSAKYRKTSEEGFIALYLLLAAVIFSGIAGSSLIQTTKTYQSEQKIKSVLGEDHEKESGRTEEDKKIKEQAKESEKKNQEQEKENKNLQNEIQKKAPENHSSKPKPTTNQQPSNNKFTLETSQKTFKSETQFESTNSQKLKTKIEDDGSFKMEYEDKKNKLKYVIENGQIKSESESQSDKIENEKDMEIRTQLEDELENELEEKGIKIASNSGKPAFSKNGIGATSNFPLSINPETKQLIITTPTGQKNITILPDQAVKNMIDKKYINVIDDQTQNSTESGQLNTVNLESRNDEPVYKIKGKKSHKIFGFIPVETETTIYASAETGNPVAQEQSLLASFINLISSN